MKHLFDDFIVDASTQELQTKGQPVAIEPRVFDVLLHLIENNDRIVPKDELADLVWQGRFISDAAISSALSAARRALGDDGQGQRYIKTIRGRGFRFVAPVVRTGTPVRNARAQNEVPEQDIRYCHSADGTRLAYAIAGEGPPLVKTANWLSHLEFDWRSPVWRHMFQHLLEGRQLIRYDARGIGLSDPEVADFTLERQVEDLESVVDRAGLDRFPLIGVSQGGAISVAYAAKHPERVSKLILFGAYHQGWRRRSDPQVIAQQEAASQIIRHGWGLNSLAVQSMLTTELMPDAPAESQRWFNDLQKETATAENAANLLLTVGDFDVADILPQVQASTLVLHARQDTGVPFESGQCLAAGIPNARFVPLESSNHILPETDPAWNIVARKINEFLSE